MLTDLSIKNVAVIEKLNASIESGMTVLTGETGAGKSIIIDSINMILGARTNKELVRYGADKARVDAVFEVSDSELAALSELGIDADDNQIAVTRELTSTGRSTARINGIPVSVNVLKEITGGFINIHGQHDNQALMNAQKHIAFLDAYAHDEAVLDRYKALYADMRKTEERIAALKTEEREKARRIDILSYETEEINDAALTVGEDEELEHESDVIINAEQIAMSINEAYTAMYSGTDDTPSAYDLLSDAVNAIEKAAGFDDRLKEYAESASDILYTLEDIAANVRDIGETVEYDEERLAEIVERLGLIKKLKRKYAPTIEGIIEYGEKSAAELEEIMLSDERTAELEKHLAAVKKDLGECAAELTSIRTSAAGELSQKITASLYELDLKHAVFETHIAPRDGFSPDGADEVEFLISMNPGEPPKPLVKVASGGELSRVILAIKSILADTDSVDTMIFDEIDTGVSGSAAQKIAAKLKSISAERQVICISHLPQLAAAADNHFLIEKRTDGVTTSTTLRSLDGEERERELARIIDGTNITETALTHAREMLAAWKGGEAK